MRSGSTPRWEDARRGTVTWDNGEGAGVLRDRLARRNAAASQTGTRTLRKKISIAARTCASRSRTRPGVAVRTALEPSDLQDVLSELLVLPVVDPARLPSIAIEGQPELAALLTLRDKGRRVQAADRSCALIEIAPSRYAEIRFAGHTCSRSRVRRSNDRLRLQAGMPSVRTSVSVAIPVHKTGITSASASARRTTPTSWKRNPIHIALPTAELSQITPPRAHRSDCRTLA
jgi:hypothetical protein